MVQEACRTHPYHTPPPLGVCYDCTHSPWEGVVPFLHTAHTPAVDSQTVEVVHGMVVVFHEIPPHENSGVEGQTLEEAVGNLACSLEEEENEGGMVEGHGHRRVDADRHNQGGRVGGADTVLVGMAVVLGAPPCCQPPPLVFAL